jgi:hypothetical protein
MARYTSPEAEHRTDHITVILSGLPFYSAIFCCCNAVSHKQRQHIRAERTVLFWQHTEAMEKNSLSRLKGMKFYSSPEPPNCLWNPPSFLLVCTGGSCQGKRPREKYHYPAENRNPDCPANGLELCTYKNVDHFGMTPVKTGTAGDLHRDHSCAPHQYNQQYNTRMMVSSNFTIFLIVVGSVVMEILKAPRP